VTSATPPGSIPTITLGGCATSQAEVALTLQRLRLIDGVGKVSLESSAKSTGAASASASATSCAGGPTFSAQITFEALPGPPTSGKSATELTSTGAAR
jgi:hypothetical protein